MRFSLNKLLAGTLLLIESGSALQADSVTYELQEVWLLPDVTHPWNDSQPMAGVFVWTFNTGDFENGSGEFSSLDLPWWSEESDPELQASIETESLEITMVGNYHDYGVDVTLQFVSSLTPENGTLINVETSSFEIQRGVSYQGHVVSGSLVLVGATLCPADFDGSDEVDVTDLLFLLAQWGEDAGDLTGDAITDVSDLLTLLAEWGNCE